MFETTHEGMTHHAWLAPLAPPLETAAVLVDLIGIAIIFYGFGLSLVRFTLFETRIWSARNKHGSLRDVRLTLGSYILLGIEFMIASDIVHTVISRGLGDLAFVAGLVAIRTAISFFLGKELEEARQHQS